MHHLRKRATVGAEVKSNATVNIALSYLKFSVYWSGEVRRTPSSISRLRDALSEEQLRKFFRK
jgi:hypothetical protein